MINLIKSLFKPSADMKKLVEEGAVIVDVRTKAEYQSGHINGSKNVPLDRIQHEVGHIKSLNKPVITVCRSGARSGMAKGILSKAGIETYNGGPWTSLQAKIRK